MLRIRIKPLCLCASPHLEQLLFLRLGYLNEIGFWTLATAKNLPSLKVMQCFDTRLDLSESEASREWETWYDQGFSVGGEYVTKPAGLGFEARQRIGHIPWLHDHHWPQDPDALLALLSPS